VMDGRRYQLRFYFNETDGFYYMDLSDVDGVAIVTGRRLVADGFPLSRVADDRRPPGELAVVDDNNGGDAAFGEIGDRVRLVYLDAEELGRAA